MKGIIKAGTSFKLTGPVLSHVAAIMTPFYMKIAGNRSFALRWSRAVRQANLDVLLALFKAVTPPAKLSGFSVNGIGYFIDFQFPPPTLQYSNGTTIPPGTAQFTFSTPIHRAIARAVIPFYTALSKSPAYAVALASAVNANDIARIRRLVRQKVTSKALQAVTSDFSGVTLTFKFRGSRFLYRNLLFREIVG
ncbi:hypothetical protein [Paenibacillus sp. R14(2021)]|uniref:hypothetical protein n=1 Tax=Paenibacillus sp. R14(2021) TaxID=2859228 RepID=UPI001C613847|nr:hypothetical protein [Paenibacillus sp. R14(2021)]